VLPVADTASRLDFSFSGLKTAVLRLVEQTGRTGPVPVADIAASFQAAVVAALVGRVRRGLGSGPATAVLVAGGVSANGALRSALTESVDVPVRFPPTELCTDNAAMIAAAGYWAHVAGRHDGLDLDVLPSLRLGS
jgi:N6-L-threonylcarbamoyladenine synthase